MLGVSTPRWVAQVVSIAFRLDEFVEVSLLVGDVFLDRLVEVQISRRLV